MVKKTREAGTPGVCTAARPPLCWRQRTRGARGCCGRPPPFSCGTVRTGARSCRHTQRCGCGRLHVGAAAAHPLRPQQRARGACGCCRSPPTPPPAGGGGGGGGGRGGGGGGAAGFLVLRHPHARATLPQGTPCGPILPHVGGGGAPPPRPPPPAAPPPTPTAGAALLRALPTAHYPPSPPLALLGFLR